MSCASQDVCESARGACADARDPAPLGDPGYGDPIQGPGGDTSGTGSTLGPGYQDQDGDGFTPREGDCDDSEPLVNPAADEVCDELDNNCDGSVDNGLGRTLVQETDSLADGIADAITYTTYRNTGTIWYRESDTNGDGVIDDIEEYFYLYDANGRLIAYEIDDFMDGTIDYRKEYFYDGAGRLEHTEEDAGLDGVLDRIDTYIYDANGVRIAWEMDTDADLMVETLYSYNYGLNGALETLVMDRFDAGGLIASTSIYGYEYDANGMMAHVHIDLTADGEYDNTTSYVYDAMGRMDEAISDYGRDLEIDSVSYYEYDAATGDLEKIEMDTDFDGDFDMRISRWETCADNP